MRLGYRSFGQQRPATMPLVLFCLSNSHLLQMGLHEEKRGHTIQIVVYYYTFGSAFRKVELTCSIICDVCLVQCSVKLCFPRSVRDAHLAHFRVWPTWQLVVVCGDPMGSAVAFGKIRVRNFCACEAQKA
uniref:Uncharacterized protein n=1 Tax=Physcomitrium patens TaxID=3218 RepID=A0A2K1KTC7_PHYPA|nr:hypothetical protein PHYPA_004014 [Physcomitrium patens]